MRTYFFHLRDGVDVLLDPEGRQLPSLEAVIAATLFEGRDVISNDARSGTINLNQQLEVEDDNGAIVHRLKLKDAVTIQS
jgi:hypothetical protein